MTVKCSHSLSGTYAGCPPPEGDVLEMSSTISVGFFRPIGEEQRSIVLNECHRVHSPAGRLHSRELDFLPTNVPGSEAFRHIWSKTWLYCERRSRGESQSKAGTDFRVGLVEEATRIEGFAHNIGGRDGLKHTVRWVLPVISVQREGA